MEREYHETTMPRDPLLEMELAGLDQEVNGAGVNPVEPPPHLEHIAKWRQESIPVSRPDVPQPTTLNPSPSQTGRPKKGPTRKSRTNHRIVAIHTLSLGVPPVGALQLLKRRKCASG